MDGGLGAIKDGSKELAAGLSGGAGKLSNIHADQPNIDMFAAPVQLSGKAIHAFPKYRYANAPYILSLALFVGVLVMACLFDLQKPAITEISAFRWYANKLGTMAAFAAAQALIASIFASFYLKSTFTNGLMLVLFSIFVSLTFLAIVFFLVVLAGNIGRFIAFVFLVLQLSTTGSSLPVQMLPENLERMSHFLPLTHSINGFKSIISLNNHDLFWSSVSVLGAFLLVFTLLSLTAIWFKARRTSQQAHMEA
ncbi:hypothetical protein AS888_14675 [Peribacillus simplex]|uniref:ABC-2 type transporter transmembrane domain-containing protein n=1 Tax=Peribacillus simplex TaxID=1478 RepID=A0A120GQ75_9BACI|nr:YhgE/Pip family protein [Peribacillus simplex]KWW20877.1 hypothetical protein AS888_14675 [Peribacillus simplex]